MKFEIRSFSEFENVISDNTASPLYTHTHNRKRHYEALRAKIDI